MVRERSLEPPEVRTKERNITIVVEYNTQIEIPEKWDNEQIKDYIKDNFIEISSEADLEIMEIEV